MAAGDALPKDQQGTKILKAVENEPFKPDSPEALKAQILEANQAGEILEVIGNGSKREFGRPVKTVKTLSTSALSGIIDYQPQELLVVAGAGTPLAQLEAALAEKGQMLPFEPPHWGNATIGGVLACNLSGPRRIRSGAARDHLLGFQAVTGAGDLVRGGGRVVKNVTGYDMSKLMCGSFGTLAVMSEVCVKVLPRPHSERTILIPGQNETDGFNMMIAAAASSHEVSGLVHFSPEMILPKGISELEGVGDGLTAIRVEGPEISVVYRCERLVEGASRQTIFLDGAESQAFWKSVKELEVLGLKEDENLWRISVPATSGMGCAQTLRHQAEPRLFHDWGGALIWAALSGDFPVKKIHQMAKEAGGHAMCIKGPADDPARLEPFTPPEPGVYQLNQNLKRAFDPNGVLSPGKIQPEV